jgi:hypothetical protein
MKHHPINKAGLYDKMKSKTIKNSSDTILKNNTSIHCKEVLFFIVLYQEPATASGYLSC